MRYIEDDDLAIGKYQVYRLDRNCHGGGVLIYVNSCFSVKVLLSGFNNLELIILSVSCKN